MSMSGEEESIEESSAELQPSNSSPVLSWFRSDFEQRLGFRGGKHTRANNLFTILVATLLTVLFYAIVARLQDSHFSSMFKERGVTPYFIVFFSFWSLSILFSKWRKLILQREALKLSILPAESGFVLSPSTADDS